ncbi:MAG: peptidoglycan DD-metalloendopeptidase family protein [Desulfobulbales bacterium]|nr:peptidoglycan DD-metalloendopeptidase family protein [Desulfobulbales bacterium]
MDSGKILANFAVCLAFWSGLVLVLLLTNGELNNNAIATPIAAKSPMAETPAEISRLPDIPAIPEAVPDSAPYTEISGIIAKGESFDQAMKRCDISAEVRSAIIRGFSNSLDFKALQPGDSFTILLDREHALSGATYVSGLLDIHVLERGEDGTYLSSRQDVPLIYNIERVSGVIESSLYNAFTALGENPKLIHTFADIFASKIDFNTETRVGDRFELLVEKYYKEGVFVGYGKILLARYQMQDVAYEGYHFASENTPPGYFDENGEALGTWFIRSPIPFGRVTSRFTMRRKHPIDGVVRPHLGVDLAAPLGTPVMATADGKVEYIGRKGGFGKTVILKHHGGYKTYYGHLRGYRKGLKKGSSVAQKDIIGYVGSTGISTGPHLDYRIKYNGVFKNPFGIKFKAKTVLQDNELALFNRVRLETATLFNDNTGKKILQVKNVTLSDKKEINFL